MRKLRNWALAGMAGLTVLAGTACTQQEWAAWHLGWVVGHGG